MSEKPEDRQCPCGDYGTAEMPLCEACGHCWICCSTAATPKKDCRYADAK